MSLGHNRTLKFISSVLHLLNVDCFCQGRALARKSRTTELVEVLPQKSATPMQFCRVQKGNRAIRSRGFLQLSDMGTIRFHLCSTHEWTQNSAETNPRVGLVCRCLCVATCHSSSCACGAGQKPTRPPSTTVKFRKVSLMETTDQLANTQSCIN